VTLKSELEITQVIENGTTRKLGYGFLFAFHGHILYHKIKIKRDTENCDFSCLLHSVSPFTSEYCHTFGTEQAQLSRRDRATLRVIKYIENGTTRSHSGSLKVIRNDTVDYGVCKTILVFH